VDALDFYLYSDGGSAHRFIDPISGEYKSTISDLLLASDEADCSSLALKAYLAIVGDSFGLEDVVGVSAVWLDGKTVRHYGNMIEVTSPYKDEKIEFSIENAN
jgi:hypothetical protein